MNATSYFSTLIDGKILNVHTAYLGEVKGIDGNMARVQPLTMYKAIGGTAKQSSIVSAVIPKNIKYKEETVTYMETNYTSRTKTFLVPDKLAVGDIVYVGICDRDITYAKDGKISEATNRHHNINDGVILRVVR